jgi:tetratricopeptide (TPR) repeat protein
MNSNESSYFIYRNNVIDSYVNWIVGVGNGMRSLLEAGKCNENIIKASVIKAVKNYDIKEFDEDTYDKLKDLGYFKDKLRGTTFGIHQCLYILKGRHSEFHTIKEYSKSITAINSAYNIEKHSYIKETDPDAKQIYEKLFSLIDWFFKNEGEPDWEVKFIKPKIEVGVRDFRNDFAHQASEIIGAKLKQDLKEIHLEKHRITNHTFKFRQLVIGAGALTTLLVILFIIFAVTPSENSKNFKQNSGSISKKKCDVVFENKPNCIKILVFPFIGKGNNIRNNEIESKIVTYYQFLNVDDITIECKSISCDSIKDYNDAEKKAQKYNANIIVWGEYEDNIEQYKEIVLRAITHGFEPYYNGKLWWTRDSIISFKNIAKGDLMGALNSTINYYMGCRFLKETSDYRKALDYFEGVTLFADDNWGDELYYNMAACYKGLGQASKTVEYMYKAIKKNPKRPFLRTKLGFVLEGFPDSAKQAKRQYELALKIDSNYAYGHQQYAFFLVHRKGEYINFKKHMNKFISLTAR